MAKLSGRVTLEGRKPEGDVVVELHNSSGDIVDQVRVDEDGVYRYHLSPATWHLRAWDAHGHGARAKVDISSDDDQVVDLDLTTEGGRAQ